MAIQETTSANPSSKSLASTGLEMSRKEAKMKRGIAAFIFEAIKLVEILR
jgi:hypothetical protein